MHWFINHWIIYDYIQDYSLFFSISEKRSNFDTSEPQSDQDEELEELIECNEAFENQYDYWGETK